MTGRGVAMGKGSSLALRMAADAQDDRAEAKILRWRSE